MSINFSTKNIKFPGALKAFAEGQLHAMEKLAGDIIDADVMVSEEKIRFKVEIAVKTRLHSFNGKGEDRILKQALRAALGAVKTQAKKSKEKLKEGKKRVSARVPERPAAAAGDEVSATGRGILLSDNYSRKPITVEEAVFFLRESKENSYMFVNAESGRLATVFLNSRGGISLIEPES